METGRECERRRGGQSQTRRWQTKAAREKEGKDVQWEGRLGKGGGRRVAGSSQRALKEKRESFCHANQMAKQSVRKDFHPVLQKTRI